MTLPGGKNSRNNAGLDQKAASMLSRRLVLLCQAREETQALNSWALNLSSPLPTEPENAAIIKVKNHLEIVALVISDFNLPKRNKKSRHLVGNLRNLFFMIEFKQRTEHNAISTSSSHRTEDKGLIKTGEEGRPVGRLSHEFRKEAQ